MDVLQVLSHNAGAGGSFGRFRKYFCGHDVTAENAFDLSSSPRVNGTRFVDYMLAKSDSGRGRIVANYLTEIHKTASLRADRCDGNLDVCSSL